MNAVAVDDRLDQLEVVFREAVLVQNPHLLEDRRLARLARPEQQQFDDPQRHGLILFDLLIYPSVQLLLIFLVLGRAVAHDEETGGKPSVKRVQPIEEVGGTAEAADESGTRVESSGNTWTGSEVRRRPCP